MPTLILPYKTGSNSAKALAEALGIRRTSLLRNSPSKTPRTLVNWGNSGGELGSGVLSNLERILNPPDKVAVAINKLSCLGCLSEASVSIPEFTPSMAEASGWVEKGKEVVVRKLLRGSGGRGIEFCHQPHMLPPAPLYTLYVKKKDEYRVHVAGGTVFDVQKKAKRQGEEPSATGWKLRNLENGFIYKRSDVSPPLCVLEEAIKAVQALELDFGAVDVIYNAHYDRAYVLEVNTACGLEGSTVQLYADAIQALLEGTDVTPWQAGGAVEEDEPESPVPPSLTTLSQRFFTIPAPIADAIEDEDEEENEEDNSW